MSLPNRDGREIVPNSFDFSKLGGVSKGPLGGPGGGLTEAEAATLPAYGGPNRLGTAITPGAMMRMGGGSCGGVAAC